jgi:hypothetical protein
MPYSIPFRRFTGLFYKVSPWYPRRQKISCFCILQFQGPSGPQNDRGFLQYYYFITRRTWRGGSKREEPQGPKSMGGVAHWPGPTLVLIWPSSIISSPFFMDTFVSQKKGMPYFPVIFWGDDEGRTLLPPPEGLICCCCQREITAIIATNYSLA